MGVRKIALVHVDDSFGGTRHGREEGFEAAQLQPPSW